jgi:hypothetical protein
MGYTYTAPVNGKPVGIGDLVIKRWSCPWLHQEAIALMEITGLVYLFIYLRHPVTYDFYIQLSSFLTHCGPGI